MDPVTLAVMATPFLVRAAEKLGEKIWEKSADAAADEAAGFGRRLLDKLLNREGGNDADSGDATAGTGTPTPSATAQLAVRSAVSDVVQAPTDQDAQAALRLAVRKLLAADPQLMAEVQRFVEQDAPKQQVGDRAVVIGGSQTNSVNVTGDSSTATYGGPVQ